MPHSLASALSYNQTSSVHLKACTLVGGFLVICFFFIVNELIKRDEYKLIRKKDKVCEPASSPRNF